MDQGGPRQKSVGDAAVTVKRAVLNAYNYEAREFYLSSQDLEQLKGMTEIEQLLLAGPAITDQSVRFIRGFSELTVLGLNNTEITDAGTACIAGLDRLESLGITSTGLQESATLTDATLKNLVVGKDLRELALTAAITDEGLSLIVETCPNLASLQLFGSRITGNGLAKLRASNKLVDLYILDNRSIDDTAALELTKSSKLTAIRLIGTSVSQRGVAALKAKLPGAWIHVEKDRGSTKNWPKTKVHRTLVAPG
jgi:hypothetical protein